MRLDDELWAKVGDAAKKVGTDRTAVVRQLLRWYVREPGADLPVRPGDGPDTDPKLELIREARETLKDLTKKLEAYK